MIKLSQGKEGDQAMMLSWRMEMVWFQETKMEAVSLEIIRSLGPHFADLLTLEA